MIRLLIVDDHAIVRTGIKRLLTALPDLEIREAESGEQALALVGGEAFQLVVLDLNLPGLGGLELLRRLRGAAPTTPILIFSTHTEPVYVTRALAAGARGYVSKNAAPEELLSAIRAVLSGRSYVEDEIVQELSGGDTAADGSLRPLTRRDLEIMRLLARGQSLAQIAATLGVAYKTVANTCGAIKGKLGVARTADLIRISVDRGLV
jgi:two-component system, NarL family, invasion response regulator UvrY